ncbi:hypothetical protein Tco_1045506 [Tanacetum coccineum]|uniref:Uncharacterized protein n=1 Tax=Tanacetum coccineum TaxID=301880 RepID=A0ABQ5GSZ6_9ASTR
MSTSSLQEEKTVYTLLTNPYWFILSGIGFKGLGGASMISLRKGFDGSGDGVSFEEGEDNEEEVEAEEEDEEEMEAEEDEDMEVEDNDDENDVEIIHPYEEVDPLNRPPPSPKTAEQEFMNAPVSQRTLQPLPPIWVKTLTKQMWDRFRAESSSFERLRRNDMRMDSFDDDLTALDSTLRNKQNKKREKFNSRVELNIRADVASDCGGESVDTTAVVKHAFEEKYDEGDDTAVAKDSQPLESCGSPPDL